MRNWIVFHPCRPQLDLVGYCQGHLLGFSISSFQSDLKLTHPTLFRWRPWRDSQRKVICNIGRIISPLFWNGDLVCENDTKPNTIPAKTHRRWAQWRTFWLLPKHRLCILSRGVSIHWISVFIQPSDTFAHANWLTCMRIEENKEKTKLQIFHYCSYSLHISHII